MYIATANITKGVEGVQLTNMTKPQTGCLHDYQLTTDDMKTLEKADVLWPTVRAWNPFGQGNQGA